MNGNVGVAEKLNNAPNNAGVHVKGRRNEQFIQNTRIKATTTSLIAMVTTKFMKL